MNARSVWLSADGQTREDTRVAPLGTQTPVSPVGTRSGILPGSYTGEHRVSGFWLAGSTGTMTATVSSGRAVIQSEESRGAYPVAVTDGITLTFADGGGQYGRIDLVVLRVYDDAYDGSGRTEAVVEIVQGTPAATPAVPAAPGLSLPLFRVAVPATAAAGTGGIDWGTALTDLRPTTVAVGGILPTRSDDTVKGAYPGQYRDINSAMQRWDGTAWVPYPKDVGGIAPSGALSTGGYTGQYRDSANGILQRWNGTAWVPAVVPSSYVNSFDAGSTTSTTYTAALASTTVTALTLTFTAPGTGAVLLHYGARMTTEAGSTATAFMSPQITQGSTVVASPNDGSAAVYGGAVGGSVSAMWRLFNLIPGTVYTMTAMHRSSDAAVTCSFDNIFMRVDPAN